MRVNIGELPWGGNPTGSPQINFSEPEEETEELIIPFRPSERRRFHEPVVLFKALIDITQNDAVYRSSEPIETPSSPRGRFERFVYKLATVCDSKKGGTTVTSFAVLQNPEGEALYVFGCNNIEESQLRRTRDFVVLILDRVSRASLMGHSERKAWKVETLRQVLLFNRPRIELYVANLRRYMQDCIAVCGLGEHSNDTIIHQELSTLLLDIPADSINRFDPDKYLECALKCSKGIKRFILSATKVYKIVNERARDGRLPGRKSVECWSELRHFISRLIAYEQAVVDFFNAQTEFPELFQSYSVTTIPSSRVDLNPLGRKSRVASNIIGRMTSNASEIEEFRAIAEGLQKFSLDERIQAQCEKRSFRPFVHSEVLVVNWLANHNHGNLVPQAAPRSEYSFFRDWRYIGSSKPTCRLCKYYFNAHPGNVHVRPSHDNLYTAWKFPDALGSQAGKRRQDIMNKMIGNIRNDAFDIVKRKQTTGKNHDSNTYSVFSVRQTETESSIGQADDLSTLSELVRNNLTLESTSTDDDLIVHSSDREDDDLEPR